MKFVPEKTGGRIIAIDSLRGIAAVMVMLFHFTTQYNRLYGHSGDILFALNWGYLGVNLFFMISGFVILMTIERSRSAMDFVVSRFSRLYPAYWIAVLLTFTLVAWMGLPKKEVALGSAVLNLTMIHGFFGVPHVDGVYWTLEIELLFYAYMLAIFYFGLLPRLHLILFGWLMLPIIYWIARSAWGIDLPWIAYRYSILAYIPYFVIGMMIYRRTRTSTGNIKHDLLLVTTALAVIAITETVERGLVSCVFAGMLYVAASDKSKLLRATPLLWLGSISYALYLLHENIGWALIRQLEGHGVSANAAIVVSAIAVLFLAWALTRCVEQPAMRSIRQCYKHWKQARSVSAQVAR